MWAVVYDRPFYSRSAWLPASLPFSDCQVKAILQVDALKLAPLIIRELFDLVVGAPAVEDHADGGAFDGLTFAGTKLDEVGVGELGREQFEERSS